MKSTMLLALTFLLTFSSAQAMDNIQDKVMQIHKARVAKDNEQNNVNNPQNIVNNPQPNQLNVQPIKEDDVRTTDTPYPTFEDAEKEDK